MKQLIKVLVAITTIALLASLSACSSSSGGYRGHSTYGVGAGVGYDGYYGRRPWGYHPGYVGGGIGPGIGIDDGPVAAQMPDMGMPEMGGMDMGMGMDMGGFDF